MTQVQIAVYDLLPASRIATAFYHLGVGIYHTAVRIPELGVEYAYGGLLLSSSSSSSSTNRAKQTCTGIFSIPSPEDPCVPERLMPGIRFLARIDVGEAFGEAWRRHGRSGQAGVSGGHNKPLPPIPHRYRKPNYPRHGSTSRENSGSSPLLDQSSSSILYEESEADQTLDADEWGRRLPSTITTCPTETHPASHSSHYVDEPGDIRPQTQSHPQRVSSVIEDLKAQPKWRASRYQLLTRNCNDFTSELCLRLTGRAAPGWINRAAWVGQSLPCLVPEGWLDPPVAEVAQDAESDDSEMAYPDDLHANRPTSPLVAIPYVQTKPMSMTVHYEGLAQV
ncbi:MAG: hypothetical protein CYPHOPRED_001790 [Cyphobasidiales sp. Tagirdzhanova-0007]|nr:MAG: hypothetical protein CYPHOPRED_001790 [Cyphobasidiales sp. Tagirdzhanova-0007]